MIGNVFGNMVLLFGILSCSRPSAVYDVGVFGERIHNSRCSITTAGKSGLVEFGRYRIFGSRDWVWDSQECMLIYQILPEHPL